MMSDTVFINKINQRTLSHAHLLVGDGEHFDALVEMVVRSYNISPFDWHKLAPEEGQMTISILSVRNLIERLVRKPHSSSHHLVVIPSAELLTDEAQNALLKVLEEPPAPTLFLIAAPHEHYLLPTIVSRCQRVNLGFSEDSESMADLKALPLADQFALADKLSKDPMIMEIFDRWIAGLRLKLAKGDRQASLTARALFSLKEKLQTTQVNRRLQLEDFFLSLKYPEYHYLERQVK